MTPKRAKKSALSELAKSPSCSATSWKESFEQGLQGPIRKPKLSLDDTVLESMLSSTEKKNKSGKKLGEIAEISNKLPAIPEIQMEQGSSLNASAGRVSLWVKGNRIGRLVRV